MTWKNKFFKTAEGSKAEVELSLVEKADMEKIIVMGFEAGITSTLENLDQLIAE